LKKYFTGSYLPTLEIDVQPSILGIQKGIISKFTEMIKEVIIVKIGNTNIIKDKCLIFILILYIG
jgi:hypothetical protein